MTPEVDINPQVNKTPQVDINPPVDINSQVSINPQESNVHAKLSLTGKTGGNYEANMTG